MKKQITTIALIHCAIAAQAQAPPAIPYQAIARNSSGTIVASAPVGLRFSIHDSSPTGTVLYSETHSPTTSDQGSFNVNIGQGSVVTGTFASINWGTNAKYLQVELDVAGGTSYTDMGTQQLLSVPYALYAGTTSGSNGWAESAGSIQNTNTTQRVGIGTTNSQARLHVADSSVVLTGPATLGSSPAPVPVTGTGSRFIWVPQNSSLRAGFAYGTQWNADSIGAASIAMGDGPTASGTNAIAMGHLARAKANNAVALGDSASAAGLWATALGRNVRAIGQQELVVGNNSYTSGFKNVLLGNNCNTISESNVTVGYDVVTYGDRCITIGNNIEAQTASVVLGTNTLEIIRTSNSVNIGVNNLAHSYSTVIGRNSYAYNSVVLGSGSGDDGVVIGGGRADAGYVAFAALGSYNTCSNGVGIGENRLGGVGNIAIGQGCYMTGLYQVALGQEARCDLYADWSVAIGHKVSSSLHSLVMGANASNNGYEGCVLFGNGNSTDSIVQNTNNYQMVMKFSGGYKFYSDAACTVGAEIVPGGNSWAVISDKRKKERIVPVQGNSILEKVKNMKLSSWNYIGQSPETFRHYGPMAQDFYAAFGHDKMGTIGNDTTINQADMAGVTFVAVQALAKESNAIEDKTNALCNQMKSLEKGQQLYLQKTTETRAEIQRLAKELDSRLRLLENQTKNNNSINY